MVQSMTEDQVRAQADGILGLSGVDPKVARSDVGQLTTFRQLGFSGEGSANKPDGWYLPLDQGAVALVLETKASDGTPIDAPIVRNQIEKYCETARTKFDSVIVGLASSSGHPG